MNFRVNKQIRAMRVRVIGPDGQQAGVLTLREALMMAEESGLDLVEVAPGVDPPVCKILDYGKFRYDQTKREKESRKAQVQVKIKEVKLKPNIDEHDLQTKIRQARDFIEKGNKVKLTCTFRGREMIYTVNGLKLLKRFEEELGEVAHVEAEAKLMGRIMSSVLAPKPQKGRVQNAKNED